MGPIDIPVLRPQLPSTKELIPFLDIIEMRRWYTNRGPLTVQLETELAEHFGMAAENLVLVSNGTDALTLCLLALKRAGRYCLMPSWSFVATALAAVHAGLTPVFIDIDPATWTITPPLVKAAISHFNLTPEQIHSVIPVAAFGAPLDIASWESFSRDSQTAVVIDAAASFDTVKTQNQRGTGQLPLMISLHATKVFGVGEGAVIIAPTRESAEELRRLINFGFWGTREAQTLGTNAKLSEYTSAVGLAELRRWPQKRNEWASVTEAYLAQKSRLQTVGADFAPLYGQGWVSSYANLVFSTAERKSRAQKALTDRRIETREWWGSGMHTQNSLKHIRCTPLPQTIHLSDRVLGLPFYTDLAPEQIRTVVETVIEACRNDE